MRIDSELAQSQQLPLGAWLALAVLVPLLGALALLLLGCDVVAHLDHFPPQYDNYYTCEVTCEAGFGIGTAVAFPAGGTIYASAGGAILGSENPGSTGTIKDGPTSVGIPDAEIWWQVAFTDQPGWVRQKDLVVTGSGTATQVKDLNVCVPPAFNKNLDPNADPNALDINDDCSTRAVAAFKQAHATELMPGTTCTGEATTTVSLTDTSCDAPCNDSTGVCVTMGWDPTPPAPDPVSTVLFQTTTLCEVEGTVDIAVTSGDTTYQPKNSPTPAQGALRILGSPPPCPGGFCSVGVAFRLTGADIEFDSGTIFADDPKFIHLSALGATEPGAITLGPFLGCTDGCLGALAAGTVFTTVAGQRSGSSTPGALTFMNTQEAALSVNWATKECLLAGDLGGQVVNDDGSTLDVHADVHLPGKLVNQPPHADVSKTQATLECTSPQGAAVTLDGSQSSDPDGNIAFYVWRLGSDTGPHVADPSTDPVVTTQQALGQTTYDLRVVDGRFAADHKAVTVSVVDTKAPVISCNAPATIVPSDVPEKGGISFKATAPDTCGPSQFAITSFACTKPQQCKVAIVGDTITILNSGGIGDVITWTVSATDAAGNTALPTTCQVNVIKK